MEKRFEATVEIDAPAELVWEVLTEFEAIEEWHPVIIGTAGELLEGETVTIAVAPAGTNPSTIDVEVSAVEPPRRLQWVGGVGPSFLLESVHTYELESLSDDRTRVTNREVFSGLLVRLLVNDGLENGYRATADALKERAEERAAE